MSEYNKAIVASIMAIIQIANFFGFHFGITEAQVAVIVSILTPFLVYFIPNKSKLA